MWLAPHLNALISETGLHACSVLKPATHPGRQKIAGVWRPLAFRTKASSKHMEVFPVVLAATGNTSMDDTGFVATCPSYRREQAASSTMSSSGLLYKLTRWLEQATLSQPPPQKKTGPAPEMTGSHVGHPPRPPPSHKDPTHQEQHLWCCKQI